MSFQLLDVKSWPATSGIINISFDICQQNRHTTFLDISGTQCNVRYECFDLVDADTLSKVVTELKSSMCSLDPIPTSLLKTIFNSVSKDILAIVNYSLQLGVFPTDFKTALVKPLLKKGNLDI